jgi:hypothetical protein
VVPVIRAPATARRILTRESKSLTQARLFPIRSERSVIDGPPNSAQNSSMQTIHATKRRWPGRRLMYGEHTVPVRVSAKLLGEVKAIIRKASRKLPLYVVGNSIKAL